MFQFKTKIVSGLVPPAVQPNIQPEKISAKDSENENIKNTEKVNENINQEKSQNLQNGNSLEAVICSPAKGVSKILLNSKETSENRKKVTEVYNKYFSQDKYSQKQEPNNGKKACLDELKHKSKEVEVEIMGKERQNLNNENLFSETKKQEMETLVENIRKEIFEVKKEYKQKKFKPPFAKTKPENNFYKQEAENKPEMQETTKTITKITETIEQFRYIAKKRTRKEYENIDPRFEKELDETQEDFSENDSENPFSESNEKPKKYTITRKIYKATTVKTIEKTPSSSGEY